MKQLLTFVMLFCTLLASAADTADNFLVATVDGTDVTYPIDSPEDFESINHSTSTSASDYSFTSNGTSVSVARSAVKSVTLEIPLTRASEIYFCSCLFCNCTNLTEANITFSGSDKCTCVGNYFCYGMFSECSSLASLSDDFTIPQSITSVGKHFCGFMFDGCSALIYLPDNFNLPQSITSVGTYFCYQMFWGCSALVSLPDDFNLPQNITSSDNAWFCYQMFYKCSKLSEGTTVKITFPFAATGAFENTQVSENNQSPSANSTVTLKGNSEVYYTIKYYDQGENLLKTLHIEIPTDGSTVTIEEFAVNGTDLVEDSESYAFRYWIYEDGKRATVEDVVSEDISLYPYITEIEKADGNSEYTYDLTDEDFDYDLHDCISTTEDGDITITVGKDAYIIIGTSENTNVTLKDAEGNTLDLETDDEGNLVYHYEGDDQANFTITATDGSVSKIIIQNVADYYRHITYYDQYNVIIGTQKIEVDTQITEFGISAINLKLGELQVFGGWMYSDGTVATVEDVITEDVALYPIITTIVIEEPTEISTVTNSAELISVEYYDLAGRKVAEAQRGVNIVVEYYSDGGRKSTKLLQK